MTRTERRWVRIATVAAGLLPTLALAHPGHGDHLHGWQLAGLILSITGLIAAAMAAIRLLVRSSTANGRRSPT